MLAGSAGSRARGVVLLLLAQPAAALRTGIQGPWPSAFPAKDLCSNCGLCKSAVGVASVTEACAFLGDGMSRVERLEPAVHGRARRYDAASLGEAHYGVHTDIVLARGFQVNAQWTGVATGVALSWLESGAVDAVVVTASEPCASGFGAPKPVLCRTAADVRRGRRVKPSLSPSLEVLDEVKADASITRLLFCGVGCAVQALRSLGGAAPETALGLAPGGLYVLGTHCVDNSPTPQASQDFVSALPGVGPERANDVVAYEFMADFKVHARLSEGAGAGEGATGAAGAGAAGADEAAQPESTVKAPYMTLPPSIGIPSIADSCFACFDYTNGLADLVVGYMGAPFVDGDEMTAAPLMVTVRNGRGRAMLDEAVRSGAVEILQEGGHGGARLPSEGDRRPITMQTVEADSMVKTLTDAAFVAGDAGAPLWLSNVLAAIIAKGLPKGLEFGRYSIDYHYLRNDLFVRDRMSEKHAERHVPAYAKAIMEGYGGAMGPLRAAAALRTREAAPRAAGREGGPTRGGPGRTGRQLPGEAEGAAAALLGRLREAVANAHIM